MTGATIETKKHLPIRARKLLFIAILAIFAVACILISFLSNIPPQTSAADPSEIAACAGESECFAFTIDTRLDATGATSGTDTNFSIPTSGYVDGITSHTYSWKINWGDDSGVGGDGEDTASGTSSTSSAGITHNYATAGEYQITIRPNGPASDGWMNAFGFYSGVLGANVSVNKDKFRSIDTPLTNLMRSSGTTFRFAFMFYGARNGLGIPADLYSNIDTASTTDFFAMFFNTFYNYAYNSDTATIPAGLFDSIDTANGENFSNMFFYTFQYYANKSTVADIPSDLFDSLRVTNGVDFSQMFNGTFQNYAANSTVVTIPSGLFDSLETANGENFLFMFSNTFQNYAANSTVATIPSGLFDALKTANGENFSYMFNSTFQNYAANSTVATIPSGLFDSLETTNGIDFSGMFDFAFSGYARNSTVATIPADLFDQIDTSSGNDPYTMFNNTFNNYAKRTATFVVNGTEADVQAFTNPYSTKNTTTDNTPAQYPDVFAGDRVVPTYNLTVRTINEPAAYPGYIWHTNDGTSCVIANPSPNCGPQHNPTVATFPNSTEWTPTTSTEHGSVVYYNQRDFFDVSFDNNCGADTSCTAVPDQAVSFGGNIVKPMPTRTGYVLVGWFTDASLSQEWNFATNVHVDMMLYAKWAPVTPGVPNTGEPWGKL